MHKNLSVNNINVQVHFSEGDDGGGKMVQGDEASFELLVPDEKLPEAVEPAMADFNYPATGFLCGITL